MSRRSGTITRTRRKTSRQTLGSLDPESLQAEFPPIIEESEPDLTDQHDDLEGHLVGNDNPQFQNLRDEAYEEHAIAIGGQQPLAQLQIQMGETTSEEEENHQGGEEEQRDAAPRPQGNNNQCGTTQRGERGSTNPGQGGE